MTDYDKYSKIVRGFDKVVRPASDYENTAILPAINGLEAMYPDDPNCHVFFVRSYFPMQPLPSHLRLPITMTVYRDASGSVTLINAFRTQREVEDSILALGPIRHIVKLGQFHGDADPYYVRTPRFESPRYWSAPGATIAEGLKFSDTLAPDTLPIDGAVLYTLPNLPFVESVMSVPVEGRGKLLIVCDSLVHMYTTVGVPIIGRLLMNTFGFVCVENAPQPAPLWVKHSVAICGKSQVETWFKHIDEMDWVSFISGHGPPVVDCSHEKVAQAVAKKLAPL